MILLILVVFNPYVTIHYYHLDESINILGASGFVFHFYSIFRGNSCKLNTQMRCRVLRQTVFLYLKIGRQAYRFCVSGLLPM